MSNTVYVVEYLPVDMDINETSYVVREYSIERETTRNVWVGKIDPRITPDRSIVQRHIKKTFFRHGRFASEQDAWQAVAIILQEQAKRQYDSYVRTERELNRLYIEMNKRNIPVKLAGERSDL